mgnify:CR=1 FL=1
MTSYELIDLARRCFPQDNLVVRPDHPLILGGPDILLARDGLLYALFVQHADEERTALNLLARLARSRLALPSHTYAILATDDLSDPLPQNVTAIQSNFDAVLPIKELKRFVSSGSRLDPAKIHELSIVHRRVFQRSAIIYQTAYRLNKEFPHGTKPLSLLNEFSQNADADSYILRSWSPRRSGRQGSEFYRSDQTIVSAHSFEGQSSGRRSLQQILNKAIQMEFTMDRGVPYPSFSTANALLIDHAPSLRHDPLKLLRCAAFLGWTIIPAVSLNLLMETVSTLQREMVTIFDSQ